MARCDKDSAIEAAAILPAPAPAPASLVAEGFKLLLDVK